MADMPWKPTKPNQKGNRLHSKDIWPLLLKTLVFAAKSYNFVKEEIKPW